MRSRVATGALTKNDRGTLMDGTDRDRLEAKLEAVRAAGAERLAEEARADFEEAVRLIAETAAPEELENQPTEQLYGAMLALWRLGARRRPDEPVLRLYNPRMEEHGWNAPHTVLEIVNDDMPFLVDSTVAALTERGLGVHALLHPVVCVARDAEGRRLGFAEADAAEATRESMIQVQLDQIGDAAALDELREALRGMLADVRAAVQDWRPIVDRLREVCAELRHRGEGPDVEEAADFLDWLAADHFTFLGCRRYRPEEDAEGAGLGLMRDPRFTIMRDAQGAFADWSPEAGGFAEASSPLLILKANRRSSVHRPAHLDFIGVKLPSAGGQPAQEHAFVGLFTSAAYNRSPRQIPLLRDKVSRVVRRAGFRPDSHDGKALIHVLETYPRDELFQASEEQLYANALGVLHLAIRPRTRLFVRPDRYGRFMSCLVFVPRERYSTRLREQVGEILSEAYAGRVASWTPAFGDEGLVRVHFVVATPGDAPRDADAAEVERRVVEAVRSWADALRAMLIERSGEHEGVRLHRRYEFKSAYREAFPPAVAAADVEAMERLTPEAPTALKFYRRLEDREDALRFKLYRLGDPAVLSDVLPILEDMGLRVLEEQPFKQRRGGERVWLHDFHTLAADGRAVDLAPIRANLEDAFAQIWAGDADSDPLNRLVLGAGLSVRQVVILRAYARFLRQARIPYSIGYMEDALAENPEIARTLIALFEARLDPEAGGDRDAEAARLAGEIEAMLDEVTSLDVDRILRRFLNAIDATLRTNAFQPGEGGRLKPYLSFKFDSRALDDLPAPRPWREIFVYATWVEGVHLRGGPVARGGLRWSDRREDYRTEVLGLVKAQQVKNAVIVPVGSKGGFLPKQLPAGGSREAVQAEAIRAYKTFLCGLLDVTDNLDGARVVPPPAVLRRDDDDPYLVVAADKGTATFSDIANGVAQSYGFWLDDAFASGGSNGYDHKAMGITARGAWVAVQRHFRELGRDIQREPFTVIGCGDMSGDVFGNGMLLSEKIRLVAAFDHRDVFIDPDPDPAASFRERKRLFEAPRSSWKDYEPGLLSEGGGVFPRSAKSIALTPQMKALTGLKADKATPAELIRALLGAECDLLWFGGIGTYVKAAHETQAEAGDRANDAVRVDAAAVRAKVVGEGANLAVTQDGRIALGLKGVRLNTDAVDNSAGVDCSDHEVNIKIALGQVVQGGDMTLKQRNALLADMTEAVAELVLRDNYEQTRAISMVEARAPMLLGDHTRFMRALEAQGLLDRAVERLPGEEALEERRAAGLGLTRPELAVLVAYAKITLFSDLVGSNVPDDPHMEHVLLDYFPERLRRDHADALRAHRLRREIIATVAANVTVNEAGPAFVNRMREEAGAPPALAARAHLVARHVLDAPALLAEIDALDNDVAAEAQTAMHVALSEALATQALTLLQHAESGSMEDTIAAYRDGFAEVAAGVEGWLSDFLRERRARRAETLTAQGAPEALACRLCDLEFLAGALDIVRAARAMGRPVPELAEVYFAAGARFRLDWMRAAARETPPSDHWEKVAFGRLVGDLRAQQSAIARAALQRDGGAGAAAVSAWAEANHDVAERAERLAAELQEGGGVTLAQLAVASSQLRTLVETAERG